MTRVLTIGRAKLDLDVKSDELLSLGTVSIDGAPVRGESTRFLPWFDTYEGDVFRRFRLERIDETDGRTVIRTTAFSDPDVMFRERRDSSGDICLRPIGWDSEPLETRLDIVLEPREMTIDGRSFTGLRYWFEYESDTVQIHRILDRQTWELGGSLNGLTLCLRNWLTPPRVHLARDEAYSTVGLEKVVGCMPGNFWGRWTLLPGFDMQYSDRGILVALFDDVSCIRSVVETAEGEDILRCVDMHLFALTGKHKTNPKTILHCPDALDDTDALNLWTRLHDRDREMAMKRFGVEDDQPPKITFSHNVWVNIDWETTYEEVIDQAAEFGADYVFIDPVWQNEQNLQEILRDHVPQDVWETTEAGKFHFSNMCCHLDHEVSIHYGGEKALKALCDRAAAKGVDLLSWVSAHYSLRTQHKHNNALCDHADHFFAVGPSGRHPDTGYPTECAPVNLNGPVQEKIIDQVLGVCKRTGLKGFLWDSFSNLGWWHVDYARGDMQPTYERMAEIYSTWSNEGLYLMPEALVAFSNHSCLGLFSGDVYKDHLLGYSYNTCIGLAHGVHDDVVMFEILRGERPIDEFFRCFAHKRAPNTMLWKCPKDERKPEAVQAVKDVYAAYKAVRDDMHHRTVLKEDKGVVWTNDSAEPVFWSFADQAWPQPLRDVLTGELLADGQAKKYRVYRIVDEA